MKLKDYYETYWQKRKKETGPPIHPLTPSSLKKYSQYGAILNQIPAESKILDLGCGDGNVSQLFLEKGEVTGVDISEKALKEARELGLKTRLHDLNQTSLPFKKNSFEVVILTDTLEHLFDPLAILKDVFRVLTHKGQAIITVPNFARLENRFRMIWGDPVDMLHWGKYGDELEHFHWFTQPKLRHLVHLAGYKKVRFIPTGLPFGFVFGFLGLFSFAKMLTLVAEK